MTEEEEFKLLEERLAKQGSLLAVPEHMYEAVLAAQRFIEASKDDLGIFTLRKAFEMGYRTACINEARRRSSTDVCGNE